MTCRPCGSGFQPRWHRGNMPPPQEGSTCLQERIILNAHSQPGAQNRQESNAVGQHGGGEDPCKARTDSDLCAEVPRYTKSNSASMKPAPMPRKKSVPWNEIFSFLREIIHNGRCHDAEKGPAFYNRIFNFFLLYHIPSRSVRRLGMCGCLFWVFVYDGVVL